jgi:hypothetical protein
MYKYEKKNILINRRSYFLMKKLLLKVNRNKFITVDLFE